MKLNPFKYISFRNRVFIGIVLGTVMTTVLVYLSYAGYKYTSSNEYCESCHVHPHATETWEQGKHFKTSSGVVVNCIQCHLPPEGFPHLYEKAKAGARDVYGYYFKDIDAINWDAKSTLEEAVHYTFDSACSSCHVELFPEGLKEEGVDAHLHYRKNREELFCVNCHLKTGHYHEDQEEEQLLPLEEEIEEKEWLPLITEIEPGKFESYTDVIPGTDVKFEMLALEGGAFQIGSPDSEPGREDDEGPQREVELSPFWMGRAEVSWREFDAYYAVTVTRGKNEQGVKGDAMTGPTPPYGSPDQGWGKGMRPAITMTHYAATKYCEWLSLVTGRTYRLPTEAEWEYAARAGTEGPYFFIEEKEPASWYEGWMARLMGEPSVDEELLSQYVWYLGNSSVRSYPPGLKEPNPWGLVNMLGNVKEFCLDWYSDDIYNSYPEGQAVKDPRGPADGIERVVRGGSYRSPPEELRAANRDSTRHDAWMKTDPQTPKSIWWYSDAKEVGFRIVREFESAEEVAELNR